MGFDVKIKANNVEEAIEILNSRVGSALSAIGMYVEGEAKARCPVDTGNLRNSITNEVNDTEVLIGSSVKYAPFVEFGTSRQSAKAFLKPAITDNAGNIENLAKQMLSD